MPNYPVNVTGNNTAPLNSDEQSTVYLNCYNCMVILQNRINKGLVS